MAHMTPEEELTALNQQMSILDRLLRLMDALKVISDEAAGIKDDLKKLMSPVMGRGTND
jgi:pilus assembly protein TadC